MDKIRSLFDEFNSELNIVSSNNKRIIHGREYEIIEFENIYLESGDTKFYVQYLKDTGLFVDSHYKEFTYWVHISRDNKFIYNSGILNEKQIINHIIVNLFKN